MIAQSYHLIVQSESLSNFLTSKYFWLKTHSYFTIVLLRLSFIIGMMFCWFLALWVVALFTPQLFPFSPLFIILPIFLF